MPRLGLTFESSWTAVSCLGVMMSPEDGTYLLQSLGGEHDVVKMQLLPSQLIVVGRSVRCGVVPSDY